MSSPRHVVRIDPMTEADVDAVLAIDVVSFEPGDTGTPRADARPVREQQLREELARSWARLYVGRVDDVIAGYILIWHVIDEIHLLNVAVAPSSRRQGVGRALVEHVIAYGRAHAAAKILLEVRASNVAAIALYEGFGFERYNVRSGYYPDGEDAVEMLLSLPGRVS